MGLVALLHGTGAQGVRVVAAFIGGFLLTGLQLFHSILDSPLVFGALHLGAPYGYADRLAWFWYVALLNMAGGLFVVDLVGWCAQAPGGAGAREGRGRGG